MRSTAVFSLPHIQHINACMASPAFIMTAAISMSPAFILSPLARKAVVPLTAADFALTVTTVSSVIVPESKASQMMRRAARRVSPATLYFDKESCSNSTLPEYGSIRIAPLIIPVSIGALSAIAPAGIVNSRKEATRMNDTRLHSFLYIKAPPRRFL